MGLASARPRSRIPYSVSSPRILRSAIRSPYPSGRPKPADPLVRPGLQVLAGGDAFYGPATGRTSGFALVADQRPHVDDALALLARDLGPVVGVGRVRQVLVFLVLLVDGVDEVDAAHPGGAPGDQAFDRQLLRPAHDVLDHGAGGEVLEVHDLTVTVLVGDL